MGVSQRLLTSVERGQMWVEMLTGTNVRVVDVACASSDTYDLMTQFEAELLCSIPKNISLVFLFQRSETVIHTRSFGSLDALNKRINEILGLAHATAWRQNESQLTVCWMDHMYRIHGLRYGTRDKVYLVWANQISIYRRGETEVQKTGDMPIIVCTDGHFGITAVYPLVPSEDNHFISRKRIKWVPPANYPMFTCDVPLPPPSVVAQTAIVKLSEAEAKERRERAKIPDHEPSPVPVGLPMRSGGSDEEEMMMTDPGEDAANEFFACAMAAAATSGAGAQGPLPAIVSGRGDGVRVEERVRAAVGQAEISQSLLKETRKARDADVSSDDGGDILGPGDDSPPTTVRFTQEPLSSPCRRGRIPIGVLARDSHRTKNMGRIQLRSGNTSSRRTAIPTAAAADTPMTASPPPSFRVSAASIGLSTSPVTQSSSDTELLPMVELRPPPEKPASISLLPLNKLGN